MCKRKRNTELFSEIVREIILNTEKIKKNNRRDRDNCAKKDFFVKEFWIFNRRDNNLNILKKVIKISGEE